MEKGLHCSILEPKDIGNCSNYGISYNHETVTLMNMTTGKVFEPDEKSPPVWIIEHPTVKGYYYAIPEDPSTTKKWWMFGGCYIKTSDSRFPFKYPVALHDRTE